MSGDPALPPTLRDAVRVELRRTFQPPYTTLSTVVVNGVLMALLWFVVPRGWFFRIQSELAFPVILSIWMFADVAATNVLAPDRLRVLAALDRSPECLTRLIRAKGIALWLLIEPLCVVLAIAIGVYEQTWVTTFITIVIIVVTPAAAAGLAAVVGVLFPYHPRPLRWRWDHRSRFWTVIARWVILLTTPYWLFPALMVLMGLPSIVLWSRLSGRRFAELSDLQFAIGAIPVCVIGLLLWLSAAHVTRAVLRGRISSLSSYLSDPDRG